LKEESKQLKPFEITIVTNGCIDGSEEMTKNSFAILAIRSVVSFTTPCISSGSILRASLITVLIVIKSQLNKVEKRNFVCPAE
jgi:hypothetical protein